jgi:hypothetical protein
MTHYAPGHFPNTAIPSDIGGLAPKMKRPDKTESEVPHMRYQVSIRFINDPDNDGPLISYHETFEAAQIEASRVVLDTYFETHDYAAVSDVYRVLSVPSYPGVPVELNNPEYVVAIALVPA